MWDEIISQNPAKVIRGIKIDDLENEIIWLEKANLIKVEFYSTAEDYKKPRITLRICKSIAI